MSEESPKEIAKAVQEVAKTSDTAMKLGDSYFGEAIKELGMTFADTVKTFRYKNYLRQLDKIEAIHKERNIQGKPVPLPLRYSIPLIEKMSMEEDETIQDLWAKLTANATDPDRRMNVKKVYIDILSQLEPLDVEILNQLNKKRFKLKLEEEKTTVSSGFLVGDLCADNDAPKEEILLSLQNLSKLGCIEISPNTTWDGIGTGLSFTEPETLFKITVLGSSLLEACKK